MAGPLSMFYDEPNADGSRDWSMTRVVAFIFTVSYCGVLWWNHANAHLIGYPFMWLGVVTLLAVPIKMFLTYLQMWFSSSPGQAVVRMVLGKLNLALPQGEGDKT